MIDPANHIMKRNYSYNDYRKGIAYFHLNIKDIIKLNNIHEVNKVMVVQIALLLTPGGGTAKEKW